MLLLGLLCIKGTKVFQRLMLSVLRNVLEKGVPVQNMNSPVISMYNTAVKYGLDNMLLQAVSYNNLPDFTLIKSQIKRIVWGNENDRWRASCLIYRELDQYRSTVSNIRMHPWWLFVKDEPIYCTKVAGVLAVLMGGQPCKYQRNFGHSRCKICESFEAETAEHILFKCNALEQYRSILWENVLLKLTEPLKESVMQMTHNERTVFLVSCLNESYINEWRDLYKAIANFIHKMYVHRALLYDNVV